MRSKDVLLLTVSMDTKDQKASSRTLDGLTASVLA